MKRFTLKAARKAGKAQPRTRATLRGAAARDPAIDLARALRTAERRCRAADATADAAPALAPASFTVAKLSDGADETAPYSLIECFSAAELRGVLHGQGRDAEIPAAVASFEAQAQEHRAARTALGLDALDRAAAEARAARMAAWRSLAATRATSPAGILAKLDAMKPPAEGIDMLRSIRRDLAALAKKK